MNTDVALIVMPARVHRERKEWDEQSKGEKGADVIVMLFAAIVVLVLIADLFSKPKRRKLW